MLDTQDTLGLQLEGMFERVLIDSPVILILFGNEIELQRLVPPLAALLVELQIQ